MNIYSTSFNYLHGILTFSICFKAHGFIRIALQYEALYNLVVQILLTSRNINIDLFNCNIYMIKGFKLNMILKRS